MERDNPCGHLWLKAIQPVKEIHEHFQGVLLADLHRFSKIRRLDSRLFGYP